MIEFDVLGQIGRDNCVAARVVTGTSTDHLLLDCGGNCLSAIPDTHLRDTTAVFFSHFHFDHFAGFDEVIRNTWCRDGALLDIFGPPGTCRIIHHRLQGFLWNNAVGLPGGYRVSEYDGTQLQTIRLLTTEKFAIAHEEPVRETSSLVYETPAFKVHALVLDHNVESIGYLIEESDKLSIDKQQMITRDLPAGKWAAKLKSADMSDDETVLINGQPHELGQLRSDLLKTQPGASLGYLTDFRIDDNQVRNRLIELFRGVGTLICENNYRDQDLEKARKNFHLTSTEVGKLALEIMPDHLVLFHVSDRYTKIELTEQLEEVRHWFPAANFPDAWSIADRRKDPDSIEPRAQDG